MAPKTIVITGCSEAGLGDALARAFAERGHNVIATGRNPAKLQHFAALNIRTVTLDVLSPESIKAAVATVSGLANGKIDMLVNNSGGGYSMPLLDVELPKARELFDLNVWAVLEVTQAFVPLLLKAERGVIVNNTSVVSVLPAANGGIYNASKAAAAMLTDNLRVELAAFGIKVVELKTGAVRTNFFNNQAGGGTKVKLPDTSLYLPAREAVEKSMTGEGVQDRMVDSNVWAKQVVGDLLSSSPPKRVWRGGGAFLAGGFTVLAKALKKRSA